MKDMKIVFENEVFCDINFMKSANRELYKITMERGADPSEYIRNYRKVQAAINKLEREFAGFFGKMHKDYSFMKDQLEKEILSRVESETNNVKLSELEDEPVVEATE